MKCEEIAEQFNPEIDGSMANNILKIEAMMEASHCEKICENLERIANLLEKIHIAVTGES